MSEEAAATLTDELSTEVTKSNFYFKFDSDKVSKNIALADVKSPGNKHRHVNVLLPHEHVHPQHYIETDSLTEEKMREIHAYYSYLVDLHISQIRPGNIQDASYVPPKFNRMDTVSYSFDSVDNLFWDYYHQFRHNPNPYVSQTQDIEFAEDLAKRATTTHYDHDKGSKYDVEWTEDQKFPHVASRLGYPIMAETPIERILEFEHAPAHPGYQF